MKRFFFDLIHLQSFSATGFGIGIATKASRPNLKVVSDFVHLHVLMSPGQWNLKMLLAELGIPLSPPTVYKAFLSADETI